jgi:hypothetical protein
MAGVARTLAQQQVPRQAQQWRVLSITTVHRHLLVHKHPHNSQATKPSEKLRSRRKHDAYKQWSQRKNAKDLSVKRKRRMNARESRRCLRLRSKSVGREMLRLNKKQKGSVENTAWLGKTSRVPRARVTHHHPYLPDRSLRQAH